MEWFKHDRHVPYILAGLGLLGIAFLSYLTSLHFAETGSALCNFGAKFDCHIVNKSVYSEFFGVPVSILGMGYFVAVIALAFMKRVRRRFALILLCTAFSLVFSLYLSGVEILLLGTVCLFCEASKVLMFLIGGVCAWQIGRCGEKVSRTEVLAALGAGALISLAAHLLNRV